MTPSRLLIYEPLCGGHRPDFVRYLAEDLRRSPFRGSLRFVLGSGFLDAEPDLKSLLLSLSPAVEVAEAPARPDHPSALLQVIADFRPDCLLLFELTKWETFLCRHRLPCDLAGILFVQYPEIDWRAGSGMNRWIRLARRSVKHLTTTLWLRRQSVRAVFLLQGERAADWLNARFPDHPVFRAIPDPAPHPVLPRPTRAATIPHPSPPLSAVAGHVGAGRSAGEPVKDNTDRSVRPPGQPVLFLLPGALSRRKGCFLLIDALHRIAPETAARAEFRLMGKGESGDRVALSRAMAHLWIRRPDVRAFLEERFVPEPEFREAMSRADWILMPYLRSEYSSGILARSAAAGTPVIGPADGLLGRRIEGSGLGRAVDLSPSALARALDEATAHPMRLDEARRAAFLERSRPEHFARALLGAGGRL